MSEMKMSSNKKSIYNFDKTCKCLQKLGYDSVKEWWEYRIHLETSLKVAILNGDKQKEFDYNSAFQIVVADGTRKCDCKK